MHVAIAASLRLCLLVGGAAGIAMLAVGTEERVDVRQVPPLPQLAPPTVADLERYLERLPPSEMHLEVALPRVTIETTAGTLHCWIAVPEAAATFVGLASGQHDWVDRRTGQVTRRPFYDGMRLAGQPWGYAILAGDDYGNGIGDPGWVSTSQSTPDNEWSRFPGALGMVDMAPGKYGAQFVITERVVQHDALDPRVTVFGGCGELDVVHRIVTSTLPVVITHVRVYRF